MSDLTDEQREIVTLPPTDRVLVIAGPGTGKTHTLIARCAHLGEETSAQILVLSFTRAVVAEIRRRTGEAGGARISASTIDGHAARLLVAVGRELAGDFDRTVIRALSLLREEPELVPRPDHVLVDEVQDLVEPRLSFVMALLEHARSGYTAFGDPDQSIFGFNTSPDAPNGTDVLRAAPSVRVVRLTRTHRKRTGQLLNQRASVTGSELLRLARPLTSIGQLKLLMNTGKAALLTRTNGEALVMASALADVGVNAAVRQGADARAAPEWIARLAEATARDLLARREAMPILEQLPRAPPPVDAWLALRRVAAFDAGVSFDRLRLAVLRPGAHDDFGLAETGTISTIHRAKGLEWDQVVVLDPLPNEHVTDEENRVLFVAATRARGELWRLSRPDFGGRLATGAGGRWELRSWAGRPLAMEMRIGDTAADEPFSCPGHDAAAVQLATYGLPQGSPALLRFSGDRYLVEIDAHPIAVTSSGFLDDVRHRWSRPPAVLTGARVLRTRSLAGDPGTTERLGLSDRGLWVGVELVGLVRPGDEEEEDDV